jgi:3-phenylpropionate/trans-cinnamate dioxygenase ferredoxin reductase subunit
VSTRRFVVVGGGVGGAAAVAELRRSGFDGTITLVCGEDSVPYERPPLSKQFLLGTAEGDGAVHPRDWYDEREIDLRLGVLAISLDPAAHTLTLSDGDVLRYDALLLATGVRPRILPGFDGERIRYLRTAGDATRLRDQLLTAEHAVVLGGGFIGCEVAASAVQLGKRATVLEALPGVLYRVLGPTLGDVIADIHRDEGVEIRAGVQVSGVRSGADSVSVQTDGGEIECDLLVVGVGTVPNTELAEAAGLVVTNGVVVNEFCATSASGVYAVGDVARQRGVRVEHHDSAKRQGRVAARNMLGHAEPFADVHWFWSDQYEHSIQSAGVGDGSADYVIRGSLADRDFAAFTLDGDRIRSVIALNRPRDVLDTRRLIATDHSVTPAQLRDVTVPLKRLTRPERAAADT